MLKRLLTLVLALTVATLGVWSYTGGDIYTKFKALEQRERKLSQDDPLYGTGFYENDTVVETVEVDVLRLGLLPTPQGIFDKHIFSVSTIVGALWLVVAIVWILERRRKGRA